MVTIDDLQEVVHGLFDYWIHKIQDGWDPPSWKWTWRHFFCRGWFNLDKMSETVAEWHVDCGYVVETGCRIPIWRTFGWIQCHVIPEPPATLQGAATWRSQCHDSRATCYIAGCCRRANSMACHPRATHHIAGCCHLVNTLSRFQSHMRQREGFSTSAVSSRTSANCRMDTLTQAPFYGTSDQRHSGTVPNAGRISGRLRNTWNLASWFSGKSLKFLPPDAWF